MTITRDANFPAEIGQLFQAFNRCAEGHDGLTVMEAAANLQICSIGFYVKQSGGTRDQAADLGRIIGENLIGQVVVQWDRAAKPTDVPVPHGQ